MAQFIERIGRMLFLLAFLAVSALLALATASAALDLTGGWQSIAVADDMVGKSFSQAQVKGDCDVQQALVYDAKRELSKTEGNWIRLHWKADSRTITKDMVGYGVWIYTPTPSGKKCSLQTKGYAEYLGKASRLALGWNFISTSKGMVDKSFEESKGACAVEKIMLYSPSICKEVRDENPEYSKIGCVGDYIVIGPAAKLTDFYLGKGLWVEAESDCILEDGTPAEVLCSEAECASKGGCYENNYITYGCRNKECVEITEARGECTPEEKAKPKAKGEINLVPELEVKAPADVKGGDTVEVTLSLKNAGGKSTGDADVRKSCNQPKTGLCQVTSTVYFYKDSEQGAQVISPLMSSFSPAAPDSPVIAPGQPSVQVIKQSVKLPEDFSGNLVVVGAVVTQPPIEAEGKEADNKVPRTVSVRKPTLPNLVATAAEAFPAVESLPTALSSATITVKNTGEKAAAAENQFLENKVSVLKGNLEICNGMRRDLVTIPPGKSEKFWIGIGPVSGTGSCSLDDKNANYWIIAEVDTMQTGTGIAKGVVAESNEKDNRNTFQVTIKEKPTCSPPGAREDRAGKYCDVTTATWKDQKEPGQQCWFSFECKTDMCILNKCISEEKKVKILEILKG